MNIYRLAFTIYDNSRTSVAMRLVLADNPHDACHILDCAYTQSVEITEITYIGNYNGILRRANDGNIAVSGFGSGGCET